MRIVREGDKIIVEQGEERRVVIEATGVNRRDVFLVRPGEVFYNALFSHYMEGFAVAPDQPVTFEAVFRHAIVGSSEAPISTIGFDANFSHAVIGVANLPDQPITFEVAFTHSVAGLALAPDGLVVIEAAFSHTVTGEALAADFVKFSSAEFSHTVVGQSLGADLSKLFGVDFGHFVEGTSAAPDVPVPGFDADYQAVLNSVASSEHPSAGVQVDQNALMVSIKAALSADGRTLADLDEFYVYDGDGTAAFKARNWANPAQTCTFASGLTLTSGGAFGDGSNGRVEISRGWATGRFETGTTAFYVHALRKTSASATVQSYTEGSSFVARNQLNGTDAFTNNAILASGSIIPNLTVTIVDRKAYAAWSPKDGTIVRARYAATDYSITPNFNLNGGALIYLYNNNANGGVAFIKGGNASWAAVQALQTTIQNYAER